MINGNMNCKLRRCLELFSVPDLISDNFIVAFMKGKDTTKHLDFRDPWNLIVLVKGVMRKIVGSDWRFNILSASHLQGKIHANVVMLRGPFLESPENFSGPKSHS